MTTWPAFADLPCDGSPKEWEWGTGVVLSPADYEHARRLVMAEEIQMRRGWSPRQIETREWVLDLSWSSDYQKWLAGVWPTPSEALVECEAWYVKHVENSNER
jgi:hypothetical protein